MGYARACKIEDPMMKDSMIESFAMNMVDEVSLLKVAPGRKKEDERLGDSVHNEGDLYKLRMLVPVSGMDRIVLDEDQQCN
jgi:hypothetical protein